MSEWESGSAQIFHERTRISPGGELTELRGGLDGVGRLESTATREPKAKKIRVFQIPLISLERDLLWYFHL